MDVVSMYNGKNALRRLKTEMLYSPYNYCNPRWLVNGVPNNKAFEQEKEMYGRSLAG